jgi:hypothetical protein
MGGLWIKKAAVAAFVVAVLVSIFKANDISLPTMGDFLLAQESNPNETKTLDEVNQDMLEIQVPIKMGPCIPTWKSLGDNAVRPVWWKKSKIGMWLHWGPQSVGREGDWYAKWIYMPKYAWPKYQHVYQSHVERYGHPSKHGYKDILPLWKAERWDPEELMKLYQRAGARYVLAQARRTDPPVRSLSLSTMFPRFLMLIEARTGDAS